MSIGDDIDTRKRQDVGGYDIGPEILDVGGSAADIENAAFGASIEQPPMEIPVEQADRGLFFPNAAMDNLALMQTGGIPRHCELAIKRL